MAENSRSRLSFASPTSTRTIIVHLGGSIRAEAKKKVVLVPSKLVDQLLFSINFAVGLAWRAFVLVLFFGEYSINSTKFAMSDRLMMFGFSAVAALVIVPMVAVAVRWKTKIATQLQRAIVVGNSLAAQRLLAANVALSQIIDSGLVYTLAAVISLSIDAIFGDTAWYWGLTEVLILITVIAIIAWGATKVSPPKIMKLDEQTIEKLLQDGADMMVMMKPMGAGASKMMSMRVSEEDKQKLHRAVEPRIVESILAAQESNIRDTILIGSAFIVASGFRSFLFILFGVNESLHATNVRMLWTYAIVVVLLGVIMVWMTEKMKAKMEPQLEHMAMEMDDETKKFSRFSHTTTERVNKLKVETKSIGRTVLELLGRAIPLISILSVFAAVNTTIMSTFRSEDDIHDSMPLMVLAVYVPCVLLIAVLFAALLDKTGSKKMEKMSESEMQLMDAFASINGTTNEDESMSGMDPEKTEAMMKMSRSRHRLVVELLTKVDTSFRTHTVTALSLVCGSAVNNLAFALWEGLRNDPHISRAVQAVVAFVYALILTLIGVVLSFRWISRAQSIQQVVEMGSLEDLLSTT